ncbi:MAG: hypothetical protein AAFO94_07915 [Bacteroidota bacterium]
MNIIVQNRAGIPNKYVRLLKWKLYRLRDKFEHLLYAEVHIKMEGKRPLQYRVNLRLGVSGPDIILQRKSGEVRKLMLLLSNDAHRQLALRPALDK